jgi:hypothetical protein
MAVALDPHPRYRVFYSIIVIQLQQEQKYNDKAVRSETPPSTGVRRIQSMRHFRAPQFKISKKMTELKISRKVRFGVFLCTPTTFVLRYSGDTPQKNLMMHPHNSEGFFMEFNCARI